jgi:hypothetical protein
LGKKGVKTQLLLLKILDALQAFRIRLCMATSNQLQFPTPDLLLGASAEGVAGGDACFAALILSPIKGGVVKVVD